MLGALSKAVAYLFYEENEDDIDKKDEASSWSPFHDLQGKTLSSQSVRDLIGQTGSSVDGQDIRKNRTIDGAVTSLHSGYGLIDNDIYFSFDSVIGGSRPSVGARVHGEAIKHTQHGGWQATRVVLEDSSWDSSSRRKMLGNLVLRQDEPEPELVRDSLVAMVTSINGDLGYLNGVVSFSVQSVSSSGFTPYKGDWVRAEVVTNVHTGQAAAESVSPLREQDFTGKVTAVLHGYGFIDEQIYFPFSACVQGYQPRRGDAVKGVMLESTQWKYCWRARTVLRSAGGGENHNTNGALSSIAFSRSPSYGGFLKKLTEDKEGISICQKTDFGKMRLGEKKSLMVWIRNESLTETRTLKKCEFKTHPTGLQFTVSGIQHAELEQGNIKRGLLHLLPNSCVSIQLDCIGNQLGRDRHLLIFDFDDFAIGRYVTVDVQDYQQMALDPSAPFNRKRNYGKYKAANQRDGRELWVVPGQRPQRKKFVPFPARLPQYEVPRELRNCIFEQRELVHMIPELDQPLTVQNYSTCFAALLHLEEIQMEIEVRDYDLESVTLRRVGEYLALGVPGLAEGRPSVVIGDKVVLCCHGNMDSGPQFEGFIHEVLREEVLLKFHNSFHQDYYAEELDAMFILNRSQLRRCHQAVQHSKHLGSQVLFPVQLHPRMPLIPKVSVKTDVAKATSATTTTAMATSAMTTSAKIPDAKRNYDQFFNPMLNSQQRAAVTRIKKAQNRPTPYILFGPPGTGKTVTVVEAILQVLHHIPGSRILACAPSNSATDLMADRLVQSNFVKKGDLVRLNAYSRLEENIPDSLKPYCTDGDDIDAACRHRVVLCTCITAGSLSTARLTTGHFTHLFIDEAGQATEPECLVAMNLVVGEDSQIVLAGDPMQLGPVLRSRHAILYGLQYSLLERLMESPLYARNMVKFADHGNYDPLLVTKLVDNYRSHSKLLQLPSQLFYHNDLRECGNRQVTHCMCGWERLPNKQVPIIFHGLRGEDLREGNSPSWFNPVEAVQVMKYMQALVNCNMCNISYDDIGIITPYRKQVEKIRLLIDKLGMEKVKVGSVEEFQGQERRVIIISTVRSKESWVGFDIRFNLGFLSNFKRFNVAITRAQSLLIVCGNPHVLAQDEHWLALLLYCVDNGTYVGCDLPDAIQLHQQTEGRTEIVTDISVDSNSPELVTDTSVVSNKPALVTDTSVDSNKPEIVTDTSVDSNKPAIVTDNGVDSNKPAIVTDTSVDSNKPAIVTDTSVDSNKPAIVTDTSVDSNKPAIVTDTNLT